MRVLMLLAALLFNLGAFASGPAVDFERLVIGHGQSPGAVYTIYQDRKGFLWFGTTDGLYRYDGYNFKTFRHHPQKPDSISNNTINTLYEDGKGFLWIGTDDGLNQYDHESERFKTYLHKPSDSSSLSHNAVLSIYEDSKGSLWVGTGGGGLNRFDHSSKQFFAFKHDNQQTGSLSGNYVNTIREDHNGTLWIGNNGGLDRFDADSNQFDHFRFDGDNVYSLSDNDVSTIFEDSLGTLWIGTEGGVLNRFDRENQRMQRFVLKSSKDKSLSQFSLNAIFEDITGTLWIATYGGGLTRFDAKSGRFDHLQHQTSNPKSLSNDTVFSLYGDKNGLIWIGTDDGWVNKYDTKREYFGHFKLQSSNPDSLTQSNVTAIIEDVQGVLWIGTSNGGLYSYDHNKFVQYRHLALFSHSLSNDSVQTLFEDSNETLWVGTDAGLDQFDRQSGRFIHHRNSNTDQHNMSNRFVNAIIEGKQGKLWVGTSHGLNLYDPKTRHFEQFDHEKGNPLSLSHNNVNVIYLDNAGTLWVGTSRGLDRLNQQTGQFDHFRHQDDNPNSLSQDFVMSIHQSAEGILWVGTDGGLNRFDSQSGVFSHYREKDGLADDTVYGILEDPQGHLWLSTNQGLSKLNPKTDIFNNFDASDGLQSNEFNHGAYFSSQHGELFFGGINGFNRFFAENIQPLRQQPNVILTDFLRFNQSVAIDPTQSSDNSSLHILTKAISETTKLTLDYQDSLISFEFAALDFVNPQKNQYAYKLQGLNDQWIKTDSKNRRATYTNLPSGNYVLQVKASNANGVWNEQGTSINIEMLAPPWLSWWAFTAYMMLSGAMVLWVIYFRVEQTKARYVQHINRNLERRVAERTAQLEQQKNAIEAEIAERTGQLEKSNQSIAALSEICSQISSILGLDKLLNTVHSHIKGLMDVDVFLIGLYEPTKRRIDFQLFIEHEEYQPEYSISMDDKDRPAVWCIDNRQPLVINEMAKDYSLYFGNVPEKLPTLSQAPESLMYWPLMVGGKIIGVMSVQSLRTNAYDTFHQYTIQTLASTTAIALDHARAYREVERQRQAIEQKVAKRTAQLQQSNLSITAVSKICTDISSTLDLNKLQRTVYNRIKALMDADMFMIGLFTPNTQRIAFKLAIKCNAVIPAFSVSMDEPDRPAVWCVEHQRPMIVNDLMDDLPRYFGDISVSQRSPGKVVESFVYWPLIVGNKVIGVLTVQSYLKNAYNEHHQDMIGTIASTTAIALDNASAYREVEQKNREILATQKTLVQSEKMASLGTLTAGVAHEINNPTNFVHVSAENLEVDLSKFQTFIFDLAGDDADEAILERFREKFEPLYRHLTMIKDGTGRIKTIVKDLRAFTYLDADEKTQVNITKTLRSTINLAHSKYKEVAVVQTEFESDPQLQGYPAQLSQVFMNLIVNACDAIRLKQHQLNSTVQGNIVVGCQNHEKHVEITVRDDGCGMSQKTKNKLFEPFYTTKEVGKGTGLGLSISYGIVQKHGGELTVESQIGVGSVFCLILPH